MSSTGPPPRLKKKDGLGCQLSMPGPAKQTRPADDAADPAGVDRPPRRLVAGAEEGVGRGADAHALGGGRGRQLARLGEGRGERLLGIDVLAGRHRAVADLGMGQRHGEVDDDRDLGVRQQLVQADRGDADRLRPAPRRLPARGRSPTLTATSCERAAALEIGVADVAAADDAELDLIHGLAPQAGSCSRNSRLARANPTGSLGLSCSSTIHFAPCASDSRHRLGQSRVPAPMSLQPSSSRFSPTGAMSLTCTAVSRSRYQSSQASGSTPPRTSQARSASKRQRRAIGTLEQQLERRAAVGERDQLPVMVVVAEGEPVPGHPLGHPPELGADRPPGVRRALALLERHGRHEQLLDPDDLGLVGHPVEAGAQVGHAHMARSAP